MSESSAPGPLSPANILQTGLAFWNAKTLLSAIEFGLFSRLALGPADLSTLQKDLNLHGRASRDFLDALVALGFLERENDLYRNTAETDFFLDRSKPSYIGGMLEMANSRLFPFWNHLSEGLRSGKPQNEARVGGEAFFESLYSDEDRLRQFLRAMTGVSQGANICIAQKFPWSNYSSFVDVGTAQGDLALQVAKANPHLKGIGFDLPPVQPIFEEYIKDNSLSERVTFQPGSFFEVDIPSADVVLMGHILHDWDLKTKKMLIEKAFKALPVGGALIVYESIIDDDRKKNAFGLLMSLNMLIETPGGFDYTGADCCSWLLEAGFSKTRVEHLVGPDSMVIAIK